MKMSPISKFRILINIKNKNFMKKLIISAALILVVPLINMAQTTLGPGTIGTSLTVPNLPHNFSTQSWNAYSQSTHLGQQICQPCHTPHNAQVEPNSPLWNHQFSTATYTYYKTIKDNTTMGVSAIDGTSKLCLSCHDGTVALGSFGGQTGGTGTITGNASLGTDLSNDHPISIDYALAKAGGYGGLRATTYIYGVWDTVLTSPTYNTYNFSDTSKYVSKLLDASGKVQCTSCHGAHSNKLGYQLKMDNRGSALCLACHSK
jgi:predicted CXXCH cytochrome family protein